MAHLDVKPENIMLSDPGTPEERATLLDFGIARLRSAVGGLQAASQRYMAPEQATHPTIACDIYALGLVAKEMNGGRIPSGIERALRQDPKNRLPSATEFGAALDRAAQRQVWNWAAAAAVILGAVFAGWYWNRPPEHSYNKPVPLVTSPGFEQRPALSPDGQWVYYASGPENRTDIYKQSTTGGNPIPLVVDPANDDRPRPTPDGLGLTFLRHVSSRETIVMLLPLSPAGAQPTELTRTAGVEDYTWAPDGKNLVATVRLPGNSPRVLRLYSIASRAWTDLLVPSEGGVRFQHPAMSPDGRLLAFAYRKGRSSNIFVTPVSPSVKLLGQLRQVTFLDQRIDAIRWTPDSRDLVFLNGPLGLAALWRVPRAAANRFGSAPSRKQSTPSPSRRTLGSSPTPLTPLTTTFGASTWTGPLPRPGSRSSPAPATTKEALCLQMDVSWRSSQTVPAVIRGDWCRRSNGGSWYSGDSGCGRGYRRNRRSGDSGYSRCDGS